MKKSLLHICSENTETRVVEKKTLKTTNHDNIEEFRLKKLLITIKSEKDLFYTFAKSSIVNN